MFVVYNKLTGEEIDTIYDNAEAWELVDKLNAESDLFEEFTLRWEDE